MTLSVIVPVLNEETFLPLYLESVSAYASEILIADGGSTDGSLACIEQYQKDLPIRLFKMKQQGEPYSDDWNEGEIRNLLVREASCDWIANLDIDEIFDDRMTDILPELMRNRRNDVYLFPFVNFWGNPWTVRVNAPGDERWSIPIVRLWRNRIGIRYNNMKHHCTLEDENGLSIWRMPSKLVDIPLYHYHYALGKKIKYNDNRRWDLDMLSNQGEPNWNYRHNEYEIITRPFGAKHPSIIQKFLQRR